MSPDTADALTAWYVEAVEAGVHGGNGVKPVLDVARDAASKYVETGTAYVDLQPGTGTAYRMVLHDLVRAPAVALLHRRRTRDRADGGGSDLPTLAAVLAAYGPAYRDSLAASVGGELLVALPDFGRGGHCTALAVPGYYVPQYVEGLLNLRYGDALWVAIFLTAFSQAVAEQRLLLALL